MRESTRPLHEPRDYLIGLSRTNEFIEARRHGEPIHAAMASAALRGVEARREAHSGRLDLNGNALNLIATLPDFISGDYELDQIHAKEKRSRMKVPREVKTPHLRKVVHFDHALREMIDNNPQLDATTVHSFLLEAAMGVYKTDELNFSHLSQRFSDVILGMQEEVITEQAAWNIDEVDDIKNADVEDELVGTDLSFTYQGQPSRIDVKGSYALEQETWRQWEPGNPLPFWTGIGRNELGSRFRANDRQLQIVTERLQDLLDKDLRSDTNYSMVK